MKLKNQTNNDCCLICLKEIDKFSLRRLVEKKIYCCSECLNKMNPAIKNITIDNVKGIGFYEYNEMLKSLIYQYKGCYDIELSKVFLKHFKIFIKLLYPDYLFVPAPSYITTNEERGFNHVVEIIKSLDVNYLDCLIKTNNVKQSSLGFSKRKEIKKYIEIKEGLKDKLMGKNVVIIDDVLTTGSTISRCMYLIKQCKVKKISFLVISYTSR